MFGWNFIGTSLGLTWLAQAASYDAMRELGGVECERGRERGEKGRFEISSLSLFLSF
jgi:hypothetical protein